MNKKLSILICSVDDRKEKLNNLLKLLQPQLTDEVQVLVQTDNRVMKIGHKRNILLDRAKGEFVTFCDDDDRISNNYVKNILQSIEKTPYCTHCSLTGIYTHNGLNPTRFEHSIKYEKWAHNIKQNLYERFPNHLNAIRRDIAEKIRFAHISHGQDRDFSQRVRSLLTKQANIKDILYYYDYVNKPQNKNLGIQYKKTK